MEPRETVAWVSAGVVLPAATVLVVVWVTAVTRLPWVVPLFVLVASPLFSAAAFYALGLQRGYDLPAPSWLPVDGSRTFADKVPARYHEEFSAETLARNADPRDRPLERLLPYVLAYNLGVVVLGVVVLGALTVAPGG